jgi:hypothetical protein
VDGIPLCLVDPVPHWSGGTRQAYMMRCTESFPMFDGREIWHLPWKPKIQRWYSDEMITQTGANNPYLGGAEDVPLSPKVPAEATDMIFKNFDHIQALKSRNFMQIQPDKTEP